MSADMPIMREPELLAPAGDDECLRAAVANGADAVYFGLEDFNARRRAANFTLARLPEVMGYLHDRNVRGYVAFNTLIFSEELERAAGFVAGIAEAGADAVIVQDLGLLKLIRSMAPTLPIHASTQMTQTHAAGIELLGGMGVRRVILARELSIDEIAKIARSTTVELEVFVHGAMCISYSGQCLASGSLWGRSANRGVCAQACRLPYRLVVDGQAVESGGRAYLLSAKDLAAWDLIPQLLAVGVSGFKIEGRLKGPHYVAAATSAYRQAIDAAKAGKRFSLGPEREAMLSQSFSRGFTLGFLDGDRHQDLVDGRFPNNRGVDVGRVVGRTRRGVLVELRPEMNDVPLKPGDGVLFDAGLPGADQQGGRIYAVEKADRSDSPVGRRATRVELRFGQGDVNLAAVAIGSVVWKTDDPAVRRELEKTYVRVDPVRRAPLTVRAWISPQRHLQIELEDDHGRVARVESEAPLAEARRHPMSATLLRAHFSRMGDTPFEPASVQLLHEGVAVESLPFMAPKSVLNRLRREGVRLLLERRAAESRHEIGDPNVLRAIREQIRDRFRDETGDSGVARPVLCILIRELGQLGAVLEWRAEAGAGRLSVVYADLVDNAECARAVERCRAAGVPVGLATPRICKPGEESLVTGLADLGPDIVLVRNLAALQLLRQYAPGVPLVADHSLNAANEMTAAALREIGVVRVTACYDLDAAQMIPFAAAWSVLNLEIVVHRHVPMFHMAHCLAARLSKANDCRQCGRPCRLHRLELRDRLGVDHPVLVDRAGRTTVYNGRVQSAGDLSGKLRALPVRHWRLELLLEDRGAAHRLIETFAGRME
ncbi:MAG TPA: U32 family peptidase [Phycisphaerae bacterium]|mgnify:CR=1 FL=1|nr:U32 family peptidase [Phycisphaerae bacterium]HRR85334.1 U32 family peptidase [Phycisphaerae bacterium]